MSFFDLNAEQMLIYKKKNRKEWIFKHNSFLPLFSKPNNTGSTKFEGKRKETLNFGVGVE